MKQVVHAACPHDCPDACGTLITVEDGRATRIQGDPAHPITQGFLCAKVAKYLDRVYSPDRVLYPMRRVAPKGAGRRRRIPAHFVGRGAREIVSKLKQHQRGVRAGSDAAVLLRRQPRRAQRRLDGHALLPSPGCVAIASHHLRTTGGDAIVSIYGRKVGTEPEQFRHSKYIIAWGANIHGNNVHLWPFVEEARRNGAKLVVIDPYRTRTARVADWHIPINPGTDVALALGLMHIIVRDGLHDRGLHRALRRRLRRVAEAAAQVHAGAGCRSGRAFRSAILSGWRTNTLRARPAVIRVNYGIQRSTERRRSGASRLHAAGDHRIVEGSRRRVAALAQRRLRTQHRRRWSAPT